MPDNDTLRFIDGCLEGSQCPDANICREDKPETCPLYDDQFELDQDERVDNLIDGDYRYRVKDKP